MEKLGVAPARKRYSSDLSARDWQRLEPLLQVRRRSKWPLVRVVNAVLLRPLPFPEADRLLFVGQSFRGF